MESINRQNLKFFFRKKIVTTAWSRSELMKSRFGRVELMLIDQCSTTSKMDNLLTKRTGKLESRAKIIVGKNYG